MASPPAHAYVLLFLFVCFAFYGPQPSHAVQGLQKPWRRKPRAKPASLDPEIHPAMIEPKNPHRAEVWFLDFVFLISGFSFRPEAELCHAHCLGS